MSHFPLFFKMKRIEEILLLIEGRIQTLLKEIFL